MIFNAYPIPGGAGLTDCQSWDLPPWDRLPCGELTHHMGQCPEHFPKAEFKIAYTPEALHLMFRVADRYVLARTDRDQGEVWKDSCVEFFFVPGEDPELGYFNLEMNCGGTLLLHFQKVPRQDCLAFSDEDCQAVSRVHSLPKQIVCEIQTPVVWTVGASIPFAVLEKYGPVTRPVPGTVWRANFHKCASQSSHPHYLTWAPVDFPVPDFHRPKSFGRLKFR